MSRHRYSKEANEHEHEHEHDDHDCGHDHDHDDHGSSAGILLLDRTLSRQARASDVPDAFT